MTAPVEVLDAGRWKGPESAPRWSGAAPGVVRDLALEILPTIQDNDVAGVVELLLHTLLDQQIEVRALRDTLSALASEAHDLHVALARLRPLYHGLLEERRTLRKVAS